MQDRDDLVERLRGLERRLAELDEVQVHQRVVAHALESIWAHLQERGVAGFPARVASELQAGIEAALTRRASDPEALLAGMDLKALADRLVLSATRPLMAAVDARLAALRPADAAGLTGLEERLSRIEQRLERLETAADALATERQVGALAERVRALEEQQAAPLAGIVPGSSEPLPG
jgi:hypothetical protein